MILKKHNFREKIFLLYILKVLVLLLETILTLIEPVQEDCQVPGSGQLTSQTSWI
jgi:hypothetical protein